MKMFKFLIGLNLLLLSSMSYAAPYSVLFDADGTGAGWSLVQTWGWHTDGIGEDTLNGETVDIVTHQQLGGDDILNDGDTFYETFTLKFMYGLNESGNDHGDWEAGSNLYVDITLGGVIGGYSAGSDGQQTTATNISAIYDDYYTSYFTSGSAVIYTDTNNNEDYDAGTDTQVATFAFHGATPFSAQGSVFSTAGKASEVDFAFTVTNYNPNYFQQDPAQSTLLSDLVSKGWLLSLAQTSTAGVAGAIQGDTASDPDEILLGFDLSGVDIRLEAVPEPATVLLFGSGLLGLSGLFRKKRNG